MSARMEQVTALSCEQARDCVTEQVLAAGVRTATERVAIAECASRVLAQDILADRDYPALPRAMRDGFAIRSADLPGTVRVVGEVQAGSVWPGFVHVGEAVEIMTGAAVPSGADGIVMIEHVKRDDNRISYHRAAKPGQHIDAAGSHCRAGEVVLTAGEVLDYARIAMLATVGCSIVPVYTRPEVAILATGDELVAIDDKPETHQIRNSNSASLQAQVARAGGVPRVLSPAGDTLESTRAAVEDGMRSDLLLVSGGVSAGKYDLVKQVLSDLGAEFYFERVRIQPGQPTVFGSLGQKFFFGLPGNPASTMVTFEVFARLALALIGGLRQSPLPLTYARLTEDFRQKPGLKRFLPARLGAGDGSITPTRWSGSGDVPALARSNAFLVTQEDRECWSRGDFIQVLPR